jgi:hypothetical protein
VLAAFLGGESFFPFAYQIDCAIERVAVDDDLDRISVSHAANRTSGQSFR